MMKNVLSMTLMLLGVLYCVGNGANQPFLVYAAPIAETATTAISVDEDAPNDMPETDLSADSSAQKGAPTLTPQNSTVPLDQWLRDMQSSNREEVHTVRDYVANMVKIIGIIVSVVAIVIAIFGYLLQSRVSQMERDFKDRKDHLESEAKHSIEKISFITAKAEETMKKLEANIKSADVLIAELEKHRKTAEENAAQTEQIKRVAEEASRERSMKKELSPEIRKEIEEIVARTDKKPTSQKTAYDYLIRATTVDDLDLQIEFCSKAIELEPDLVEAYNNRGLAYGKKGEHDRAIEDLNKAIELKPDLVEAYNNRGLAYGEKGEHDRAIEDLNKAIKLKPDLAEAYNNRGLAYGEKGEHDRAIEDLNKAIKLKPDLVEAYNNRGSAYNEKGEHDRAIEDLNKAIELKPNYGNAFSNFACAYAAKGENEKAIHFLEKSADNGCEQIRYLKTTRLLTSLRVDPRFEAIMKRIEANEEKKKKSSN